MWFFFILPIFLIILLHFCCAQTFISAQGHPAIHNRMISIYIEIWYRVFNQYIRQSQIPEFINLISPASTIMPKMETYFINSAVKYNIDYKKYKLVSDEAMTKPCTYLWSNEGAKNNGDIIFCSFLLVQLDFLISDEWTIELFSWLLVWMKLRKHEN